MCALDMSFVILHIGNFTWLTHELPDCSHLVLFFAI